MTDIYIGLIIISLTVICLFWLSSKLAILLPVFVSNIIIILTAVFLLIYLNFLTDSPFISKLLPFSNLIIIGNWTILICSFLAGFGWQKIPGKSIRKSIFIIPLFLICIFYSYGFILSPVPTCYKKWKDGICLQSSESSCLAACAVTLLKYYNIDSSEEEMAKLSLTRKQGTKLYGIYRALKKKTARTQLDVEIFTWDIERLLNETKPVIIKVGLEKNATVDPRYHKKWGWAPGMKHAIVFFGSKENGQIEIGDPFEGREHWDLDALKVLWDGQGIRLVSRN